MTTIRCIIVDDEPLAIRLLEKHVGQVPHLELIGTYTNPIEALSFLQQETVDLLFLDIQMPALTGIDFVRTLRHPPKVVFTTAYRDYAVESYELEILDYLVKPITFPRFLQAVQRCSTPDVTIAAIPNRPTVEAHTGHCYVNANKKYIRVNFAEITYIESIKDYIRIHTIEQRIMTKQRISVFAQQLPSNFLRIHRSFIVNLDQITAFTAQDVEIGQIEIPIGGHYKQNVMTRLQDR